MNKHLSKIGVFSLMLAASFTIMVGSAITPALLDISTHYGLEDYASWLTTLPAIGVVLFAPIAGRIIDRIGAYRSLCIGLVFYGLFGVAAIWLSGMVPVFADRILLGAATAVVMASGTALLAEFFEGEQRLKMIALQGMSIEAGGIIFLSIGGMLGALGWQWPFTIYLLAWVTLFFILFTVPFKRGEAQEESDEEEGTSSSGIYFVLISSLLAMLLFFVAFITLPFYLSENFGLTSVGTGYFLAFISTIAVVSASVMPKVVKRITSPNTLMLGFLLFTLGHFVLAVGSSSLFFAMIAAVIIGFGFGFTIPLANHMTVEKSSPAKRGKNLAYFSSFTFLGQFLSSFVESISNNAVFIFLGTSLLGAIITLVCFIGIKRNRVRSVSGQFIK